MLFPKWVPKPKRGVPGGRYFISIYDTEYDMYDTTHEFETELTKPEVAKHETLD